MIVGVFLSVFLVGLLPYLTLYKYNSLKWPPKKGRMPCVEVTGLTLGVMLLVMQKARCCWMLSMLWQCCCLVVLRYFCRARAMDGKMACAASRGSITSPGAFFCSSSCMRLMCVNASSTATTSLGGETANNSSFNNSRLLCFTAWNAFWSDRLTVLCVCGRASRARPLRSTARCGWCLCGGRQLRSSLWTENGRFPLLRCFRDLPRQNQIDGKG